MIVGIDGANIRGGGGLTHLREVLAALEPGEHRIEGVRLWGGAMVVGEVQPRSWLRVDHVRALDGPLPSRLSWQKFALPRLSGRLVDVLFVPGGIHFGGDVPFVAMSQNLLPFEAAECKRYGVRPYRWRLELVRRAQLMTFKRADGVIFLNQYSRDLIGEQMALDEALTRVVPHGISGRFRPPVGGSSDNHSIRLIYVSTVDLYKHQWHVVQAVADLRKQGYPVELDLVGSGHSLGLRRLKAALQGADPEGQFVRYHGVVPHDRIPAMYRGADAAVFASSCEAMSNILIEGMASGLPTACSARGPLPEILGNAGVYFDPERVDDIAGAIRILLDNASLREELAQRAVERASRYSWERCAAQTFSFLVDVGRGKAASTRSVDEPTSLRENSGPKATRRAAPGGR